MEEKPNYFAIIPASVRYDNNLTPSEKLFYGEITALTQKTGECWASNSYFAKLYGVSTRSITNWVSHLEKYKYIQTETINKDNSKEIEKRVIRLPIENNFYTYRKKFLEGYRKKELGGIEKNFQDNNTSINNTSIKENIKRKYFENEELNDLFNEFLELRKKLKCKNTDRAITLLLNELNKYPDDIKKEMINNSIMGSWKSVYPLKNTKRIEPLPEWFGKEIVNEKDEEVKEIERRFFESIENEENEN